LILLSNGNANAQRDNAKTRVSNEKGKQKIFLIAMTVYHSGKKKDKEKFDT